MRHERFFGLVLIGAAIIIGLVGWSGNPLALPASSLFPAVWALARRRVCAAAVSAGYFLAASRGLPQGVATYYESDLWPGFLLWFTAAGCFVAVHGLLWTSRKGWRRMMRYLAAMFLMAVPPFGIMGWAHPLTAAGILFPGWSWLGLLAMGTILAAMVTKFRSAAAATMSIFWLWSAIQWAGPAGFSNWHGLDLELGSSLGRTMGLSRQLELNDVARGAAKHRGDVVVLPESALGFWTPMMEQIWTRGLRGSGLTVLAGAALAGDGGYDNVLVEIAGSNARVLYRQRMPVPGSMWQPWSILTERSGARAHLFDNAVVEVGGIKVAPLICYEQLLVWPVLHSLLNGPDVIVAIANGWWTAGTTIIDIQIASSTAWARLFAKPLVISSNR